MDISLSNINGELPSRTAFIGESKVVPLGPQKTLRDVEDGVYTLSIDNPATSFRDETFIVQNHKIVGRAYTDGENESRNVLMRTQDINDILFSEHLDNVRITSDNAHFLLGEHLQDLSKHEIINFNAALDDVARTKNPYKQNPSFPYCYFAAIDISDTFESRGFKSQIVSGESIVSKGDQIIKDTHWYSLVEVGETTFVAGITEEQFDIQLGNFTKLASKTSDKIITGTNYGLIMIPSDVAFESKQLPYSKEHVISETQKGIFTSVQTYSADCDQEFTKAIDNNLLMNNISWEIVDKPRSELVTLELSVNEEKHKFYGVSSIEQLHIFDSNKSSAMNIAIINHDNGCAAIIDTDGSLNKSTRVIPKTDINNIYDLKESITESSKAPELERKGPSGPMIKLV